MLKTKWKKGKLWVKIVSLFVVTGIIALGIGFIFNKTKAKEASAEEEQLTATISKGNLSVSLLGSGAVTPTVREEVVTEVDGTITSVNVQSGDVVSVGDILVELDDVDAKLSFEQMKNTLEEKKLSYESAKKSADSLSITAPFSGIVTDIKVKENDTVSNNGVILTITDTNTLEFMVPFGGSEASKIYVGQSANVFIQEIMQGTQGTVTYVSNKPYVDQTGGLLYNVIIKVNNPGLIKGGMYAGAEILVNGVSIQSTQSGELEYINTQVLKCDAGGDVVNVNVVENQYVSSGQLLVALENDDAYLTAEKARLAVADYELEVASSEEELGNYKIKSPIDGVIVEVGNISVGDRLTTNQSKTICTIVNTDYMEFDVTIDELDIAQIELRQKTSISIDALEDTLNRPLEGEVTKIAIESDSKNGVTTYPVTITVQGRDDLLGGMNADAEIFVAEKSNAILAPIEAVQRVGTRSFVYILGEPPEGFESMGNVQPRQGGNLPIDEDGEIDMSKIPERMQERFKEMSAEEQKQMLERMQQGGAGGQGGGNFSGGQGGGNFAGSKQDKNANSNNVSARNNTDSNNSKNSDSNTQQNIEENKSPVIEEGYYKGAYMVPVTTGLYDSSYIEIVSGLNQGDIIVLPQKSSSSSTNMNNTGVPKMMPMGGMGGMGQRP